MHPSTILLLMTGSLTLALPLNINLGAYSPALVVGDGALTFEGAEGAEAEGGAGGEAAAIVAALQGAAVSGAAGVANGGAGAGGERAGAGGGERAGAGGGERAGAGGGERAEGAQVVQAASAGVGGMGKGILNDASAALPAPGSSKVLDPRV
ncbi:hypothetical protein C8A05DRAFT_39032 [Staphylotrichum tortipilum]|uniref:Uncharacterized protein n=1 Tax=Staphylotrichum tortipilum TaxID=2831512 RepID=A0AAN6MCC2_9PEZI|nr:hypothetical protein C8A05DRAFT_39032 [Staphylotrichum longicolle]